jgi:hypothetical protein
VSEYNTISITYNIDWAGIKWEDEEVSVTWCWSKFIAKANADKLTTPPALRRKGIQWTPSLRKENNTLWVILKEGTTWAPENDGPPPIILFGPDAEIRMRSSAPNAVDQMIACLCTMCQGKYVIIERVATREWGLVASIGDKDRVGQIPIQYRLPEPQVSPSEIRAIHQRVLDACLRTQNYDRGLDKFARKFERLEAMSATVAIQQGWQGDHGWAIFFKQGPRRALLMDTVDGLTDEEVLWTALACWAIFIPRKASKRIYPGRLFYPDGVSHILAMYWNHLCDLPSHPNFKNESPVCQQRMTIFSQAWRKFKRMTNWAPQPTAEAPEKNLRIAEDAALSRVRSIADGPNQWEMYRSSTDTDGSGVAMVGTESSPGLGTPDTSVARGNPSQT